MHLVHSRGDLLHPGLYQNRRISSRPDSLPFIFRKLRIHRTLTKKALGDKLGFSEEYITAIEGGSKFPSLNYCLGCAKEFGANPYWVKTKYSKEVIERFSDRIKNRLGIDQYGGVP